MKLGLALATIIGIFGVALLTATAQATSVPSQCTGMTFDNVIDQPNTIGVFTGTAGRDLIIVKGGIIDGLDGDDCIKVSANNSIVFGSGGNDVIITTQTKVSGHAYGDYQQVYPVYTWEPEGCDPDVDDPCVQVPFSLPEGNADRCIGKWAYRQGCEATN